MKDYQGYMIESSNLKEVNMILSQARKRVMEAQKEEFHRLLAEEITTIVDDIALNIVPEQEEIMKQAETILRQKIGFASYHGYNNEYNFEVRASMIPDKASTYLMLYCPSDYVRDIFAKSNGIIDYSTACVKEESEQKKRENKWRDLEKEYGENNPLIIKSYLSGEITVDIKLLHFMSPKDRAYIYARHKLMNLRLNMFASGKEIPPSKLMQYMDKVLESMLYENTEDEIQKIAEAIIPALPKIDFENNHLHRFWG